MTLQDQVSALKDGDYVRAVFEHAGRTYAFESTCQIREPSVYIGGMYIIFNLKNDDGKINANLTSVTVIDRPLPPEPEVFTFALLESKDLARKCWDKNWWLFGEVEPISWPEIYPQIVKMWDKDGNEVAL